MMPPCYESPYDEREQEDTAEVERRAQYGRQRKAVAEHAARSLHLAEQLGVHVGTINPIPPEYDQ